MSEEGEIVEPYFRYTRAEISLDALRHNLGEFRRVLPSRTKLMAVVKANAYGHGLVGVVEEAVNFGVDYVAVAFLDEAIELRRRGVTAPVLVLGYTPPEGIEPARELGITLTAYGNEFAEALEREAAAGVPGRLAALPPLKLHIKVDTGMGRIGLSGDDAVAYALRMAALESVEVEGLFTHYACADEEDKTYTHMQYRQYQSVLQELTRRGLTPPIQHIGNSAAGIDTPEWSGNMLRLGIGMYGMYPSAEVNGSKVSLTPVMSFKTGLVHVKDVPPGHGISYGIKYVTESTERIGTLPVGYADGFSRLLSGKAEVLHRGKRVKVVGRICMDQCMIRIGDGDPAEIGDEIVLMGAQGDERITADEIADKLGTINYEVTCMVQSRVPRVYIKDGRVLSVANSLLD